MSVIKLAIDVISAKSDDELLALIESLREDIELMRSDEFGQNEARETFKETLRKAEGVARDRGLL